MTPSDADLLRRVPGDAAAVEAFYRRHVDRVRAFAARRCARPEDVADAVSGTFLAVLDAAPGYDPRRGDAVPWLLGIATNVLAGQRRRAARDQRTQERVRGRRLLVDAETFLPLRMTASWAPGERYVIDYTWLVRNPEREASLWPEPPAGLRRVEAGPVPDKRGVAVQPEAATG
jgi:DNA-directed RNA polymerase specialized sigma24 family protein